LQLHPGTTWAIGPGLSFNPVVPAADRDRTYAVSEELISPELALVCPDPRAKAIATLPEQPWFRKAAANDRWSCATRGWVVSSLGRSEVFSFVGGSDSDTPDASFNLTALGAALSLRPLPARTPTATDLSPFVPFLLPS
jgi:hypothetical protein